MKGDKNWLIILLIGVNLIMLSIVISVNSSDIKNINKYTGLVTEETGDEIISPEDSELPTNQNVSPEQNASQNQTINETVIPEISLLKVSPTSFKIGESQFTIQIQNNNNETISEIFALTTGSGFSTYDILSIDNLAPGEKGFILVYGNFNTPGNITLTIKIRQYTFYQNVTVISSQTTPPETEEDEINEELLAELSSKLEILKSNYTSLEEELNDKKDAYDISDINLKDLKGYIRNAEAAIIAEEAENANINIILGNDELEYQRKKLENAEEASKVKRLRDYLVTFSAIAGAIITLFALFELLKRKSKETVSSVKHLKESKIGKKTNKNSVKK